jgi:hypothetical protein
MRKWLLDTASRLLANLIVALLLYLLIQGAGNGWLLYLIRP